MNETKSIDSDCDKGGQLNLEIDTKPPDKIDGEYTFDEALDLLELGKFYYKLSLVCGLCYLSSMTELSGVGVILPVLACDMNATLTERGILLSAAFVGVVLGSHALGFAADIWGRIYTLRIAFAVCTIFIILSAFSVNMLMLILTRVVVGITLSSINGCIFTIIGEYLSCRHRSRYLALISVWMPLSNMVVPLICMFILPISINIDIFGLRFVTWRIFYLISTTFCILATFGLFMIPETPKFILYQDGSEKAIKCLRGIFALNTGKPANEYPVKSISADNTCTDIQKVHGICEVFRVICTQTISMFTHGRWLQTVMLCLFMFILNGVIQGLYLWLPTILETLLSSTETYHQVCNVLTHISTNKTEEITMLEDNNCSNRVDQTLYILLIFVGAIFTISFIMFAFLIDLLGKRRLLIIWIFWVSLCFLAIHYITNKYLVMFVLTMIVNGGICGSIVGIMAVEFYPTNICAMACCSILMISRIGAVIGSNVLGQFIFTNCELSLWIMFGIFLCLVGLGWFLPSREEKKKT